jgi:Rrf2 family protein
MVGLSAGGFKVAAQANQKSRLRFDGHEALGRSRARGKGSASAKDVADSFGIPPEALAKILQRLAKAGLLHSQHGTNGGYRLARAAHTISAFEVIQAIDGPLFITSCVTVRGECGQSDRCNIREPLRKVNESIEAVLKRIKISHMREEPEVAETVAVKSAELVTIA